MPSGDLSRALSSSEFEQKAAEIVEKLSEPDAQHPIHPLVVKEFSGNPPTTLREVADNMGALLRDMTNPKHYPMKAKNGCGRFCAAMIRP